MTIASQTYYVRGINTTKHTITAAREDLFSDECPTDSIAINFTLVTYTSLDENITLFYNCSSTNSDGVLTTCNASTGKKRSSSPAASDAPPAGSSSGGSSTSGSSSAVSSSSGKSKSSSKTGVIAGIAAGVIVVVLVLEVDPWQGEHVLRCFQVFSYEKLQEATNKFHESRELGDGGFGTVYYGELPDGCLVAVKRLYENSFKRVSQFMNEVEILARISHKNLVTLYGCTSKKSKELLLVYEFIPNGTVADHLHGKLSIAVETTEALAYLHASDVIHRDVKSNNILLDNSFQVKVADFGLSRLCPTNATHVSTAPQGNPGYVDPEYFQLYRLTEKSDVYSFGVVLIELISSKPAVDTSRHCFDVNLANMAVDRIQNEALGDLLDPSLGFEKDQDVQKR
ncbi:LEAF RUST 10 DISEASE-RESISTANCE LOCUS RECEPTOR-LIKE PROTEIN [Drosera capensis]